ncbi:MAG TPA: L,D-transpeptidase family protein, partial [Polyangium sp.]|nr:L,D-transpeptidase family protein [Polyangium sp.]
PTTPPAPKGSARVATATPVDTRDAGVDAAEDASPAVAEAEKPYTGPLLGALAVQTPVYPTMESSKKRLGYIRLGGKVPVDPNPTKNASCQQGWYRLLDGGYVCGKYSTTDLSNPQVRMGITAPNLEEVLPYRYAYNTAHGTPLYRSVPSKEDMIKYEPYLEMAKKARRKKKAEEEAESAAKDEAAKDQTASAAATPSASTSAASDTTAAPAGQEGAPSAPAPMPSAEVAAMLDAGPAVEEPAKPWWQQLEPGKPVNVTLKELESEADGTVAKRMVKGFFVAVDKTFSWNSRTWYKTTAGLVAPSDRMYIVKPPASQGIDVPEGAKQVGFILATKSSKFEIDDEHKNVKVKGPAPRFTAAGLTGVTATVKSVVYRQTTEGWWMKGVDATYTEPGSPPADLAPGEKWLDVNITRKTIVAFEGDKPVYAALVSPGRRSTNKAKDHSTIKGTFRIREKHIAVTMDGDGTVAGDLPYSIEDVPYVAYFEGSYALHGAFWHSNFGREMSHGCVNLSPLDAKKIFFWSEPRLPRGWHAVWSTPENRGTLVVVHE